MDQRNPESPDGDPYEFILNPQKSSKPKPFKGLGGGNRFVVTIVMIVGGVLLFMIVITVLLNALAPKKISKEEFTGLVQTQHELIRVANQGTVGATRQTIKNLATTVEFTMMTQEKQTIELLGKNGVKVGEKQLALKQNAETDKKFASAKATSTFDAAFTQVMEDSLNSYATTLKQMTALAPSTTQRDQLSDYYKQTQQLISQIPYTQTENATPTQ
jgi:hypothetical protein